MKTNFYTMPVAPELKDLQNKARRGAIRERNAARRFAALKSWGNADLERLEKVEEAAQAEYDAFNDALKAWKADRDAAIAGGAFPQWEGQTEAQFEAFNPTASSL